MTMQTIRTIAVLSTVSLVAFAGSLGGCEKKADPAKPVAGGGASAKTDDHAHKEGDGHDHGDDHDHGATTELGEQSAGGFTIKASRDGDVVAGKDAAIDAWVTGGTSKVAAVRFWIGTQDAKGSMKAKAELEKDNWHTHAEIPSPMPEGSKLWVEVETDKGEKTVVGFELKA
jgi:hypothetical protein